MATPTSPPSTPPPSPPLDAHAAYARIAPRISERAYAELDADDADAFLARVEQVFADAYRPLSQLYGGSIDVVELVADLFQRCLASVIERSPELRRLDRRREIDGHWFQRSDAIGYVCYVDRFAGKLRHMRTKLDYLTELGVSYLHLMPLLRPRDGANDGGYAVANYREVDPALGTMDDLSELATDLHRRGMSLCIDFVLNHTAREHEWARRAMAGEAHYRDFYLIFDDRTMPDAYEQTLPEVFPDLAPGNFTWSPEVNGWVWTTFNDFQWDLNYANPDVFSAMLDTMLTLSNRGVDVLRLDAVPFTWKRLGTDCQNQPEAHLLLQAFRALVRAASPATIFKAEAIVPPHQLRRYLGAHNQETPECDLAYHNQLMVMLWSSLAAHDGRLITQSLASIASIPRDTAWVTYVRCHDDIGWAVDDGNAAAVGWNGFAHRSFLNDFYSGDFPGSYARGARFQINERTGDARISGMTAALCGITAANEPGTSPDSATDAEALRWAIRRLDLLYAAAYSYGGVPLIYSGDEIALGNDSAWAATPGHETDNRWMHRPSMDWAAADRRHDPDTVQGQVFARIRRLGALRTAQPALRSGGETTPLWTDNPHVFAYRRQHPRSGPFLALINFDLAPQEVADSVLNQAGIAEPELAHSSHGDGLVRAGGRIALPGLGYLWLTVN
jgi:amylosucrase